MQTVNTNVGNSPVAINPGVEQLLIQFGSYQTETTLQTTLHVTYSDVQEYELIHDFTVHIVADDSQQNNQILILRLWKAHLGLDFPSQILCQSLQTSVIVD